MGRGCTGGMRVSLHAQALVHQGPLLFHLTIVDRRLRLQQLLIR